MKRSIMITLLLAVIGCMLMAEPCWAKAGEARFGTGLTKDLELIGESRELDTNLVTCAFYGTKAFGVMTATVSIYYKDVETKVETLLLRADAAVNPTWGVLIFQDLPLPTMGKYTFTLSTTGGEVLSTGDVVITEKKVDEKMPEQPKADGKTLEGLFNKFKPTP